MVSDTRNTFLGSIYAPIAAVVLVTLGVCLLGSNAADRNAAEAKVPDVVKTYHSCEYLGEDHVMAAGEVWSYLSTSCGRFDPPYKKHEWEKGKSYEIQTTLSATKGSYISKVTPSP